MISKESKIAGTDNEKLTRTQENMQLGDESGRKSFLEGGKFQKSRLKSKKCRQKSLPRGHMASDPLGGLCLVYIWVHFLLRHISHIVSVNNTTNTQVPLWSVQEITGGYLSPAPHFIYLCKGCYC